MGENYRPVSFREFLDRVRSKAGDTVVIKDEHDEAFARFEDGSSVGIEAQFIGDMSDAQFHELKFWISYTPREGDHG